MRILAIDSSSHSASIALVEDNKTRVEITLNLGLKHSETLFTSIDYLSKVAQCPYTDMDFFACVIGPGSFTGLRIGIAGLKGIAYASKKPLIGVSSLEAFSYTCKPDSNTVVVPIMDARNGRVYTGAWCNGKRVLDERALHIQEWKDTILTYAKENNIDRIVFVGETDFFDNPDYRISCETIQVEIQKPSLISATVVAKLALKKWEESQKDSSLFDPKLLNANYLVPSQAEQATGINID